MHINSSRKSQQITGQNEHVSQIFSSKYFSVSEHSGSFSLFFKKIYMYILVADWFFILSLLLITLYQNYYKESSKGFRGGILDLYNIWGKWLGKGR